MSDFATMLYGDFRGLYGSASHLAEWELCRAFGVNVAGLDNLSMQQCCCTVPAVARWAERMVSNGPQRESLQRGEKEAPGTRGAGRR